MIFKKNALSAALLFSSVLALAACGNADEVEEPVSNESTEEPATSPADASPGGGLDEESIGGKTFGFTDFSLDVDYPDQDDALDVSYEEDRDQVEAEYENKLTDTHLEGGDALDEFSQALSSLEVDSDTEDEQVIQKVIEAFEIEDNYESIEVEITYPDGNEKEYQAKGN